ncbi:hypothetical protein F5883DRAFT_500988 [Diaporthe sp. PMI_573]|nr:hypothetical protein F5883DRAFT_500988 [Diaporthaceae sp. PMI_573]
MPKVAKGRRKRAYGPKTRTGCLTCKARRVKCDETRPNCLRCTTTRRVCNGYAHVPCVDPSDLCRVPLAFTIDPSADVNPCVLSRRSFAFFIQKTSPQLAGLFGSAFWERLVLQTAHYEPAIRHAITAIGSLHEQHIFGRGSEVSFALQQYNLAIKSLLAPPSPGQQRGLDVSLIACILFTCFENMQGHHAIAGTHIRSGSKLLQGIVHSDVIGLEAIWIGLDLSENGWTGFGFLEDLDWIGLIGNQLLELQWSNLIRQELSLIEWS